MLAYVFRRLLWAIPTLWLAITITFFGLGATFDRAEGNAFGEALNGPSRGPGFGAAEAPFVFEGPPHEQYLRFLAGAVRLDWGASVSNDNRPATDVLRETFRVTAGIGLLAFLLAAALGIPLGALAAARRGWTDRAITSGATLAYSFPSLVLAILLLALSVRTVAVFPITWNGTWSSYPLPILVLALSTGGYLARVTRVAVLDVLGQDYVRTARSKGLGEGVVRRRHVLANALPTILGALGPTLGLLLAGSLLVEYAFGAPGTGKLLLDGFAERDYPLILAGVSLYTTLVLVANLAADVAAGLADPRIRGGIR